MECGGNASNHTLHAAYDWGGNSRVNMFAKTAKLIESLSDGLGRSGLFAQMPTHIMAQQNYSYLKIPRFLLGKGRLLSSRS